MTAYNVPEGRGRAVRAAAELLGASRVPFFPLDIRRLLSPFSRQVFLLPYSALPGRETGKDRAAPEDGLPGRDGFCARVGGALIGFPDGPREGPIWNICYNDARPAARIRFTVLHETGHILLGHHLREDALPGPGRESRSPADGEADAFAANALAPAPAVLRLLEEHGFSLPSGAGDSWRVTDPSAPFLRHLGRTPEAAELVQTAFGISAEAARRRLGELKEDLAVWRDTDPGLRDFVRGVPRRAGWHCAVCGRRRRAASLYCTGCGKSGSWAFIDPGRFPARTVPLRDSGRFSFCSVCGSDAYPDLASFCPVCGCPVTNPCENAFKTDGDFIRSGMPVVRGTHFCRPTDIFCGRCGTVTAFGARHGPKENMWLPSGGRCRAKRAVYPPHIAASGGRVTKCPACGSAETLREGRYCAKCLQPLQNSCTAGKKGSHPCAPDDRYCPVCGEKTLFFSAGLLPAFDGAAAREEEDAPESVPPILLCPDGTMRPLQEA